MPAPGPPRTKTTTGFMRRRRRRRCSSRTAAEGRRPWGGRRAGGERRGRGRAVTGAVTVAPLPPRCPCGGKVLPGPGRGGAGTWARGWRRRLCRDSRSRAQARGRRSWRGAPAGPGVSVHCSLRHSPSRHSSAWPGGSASAAMATPPHRRTAPAHSPPPGIFKPPARALAVGFPGARSDWLSEPFRAAR